MTEANLGWVGKKQELEEASQSKELSVWFLIIPLLQLSVALGIIPSMSYLSFKIRVKFLPRFHTHDVISFLALTVILMWYKGYAGLNLCMHT